MGGTARYRNLWRLLGELRHQPGRVASVLVLILIVAVAYAALPWLITRTIDRHVLTGDRSGLATTGLLLAAVIGIRAVAECIQLYQVGLIAQQILTQLRTRLFATFQSMPIAAIDRQPTGQLMSRITSDVETLNALLTQIGPHVVAASFNFLAVIIAMLLMEWKLALATYVVIPFMAAIAIASGGRAHPRFRTTRETAAEISTELQETMAGLRDIQVLNRTDDVVTRFRSVNARNRDASIRAAASLMLVMPAIDVLSAIGTGIVLAWGGYLALTDQTTVGTVAGFVVFVHLFFRPIATVATLYERLPEAVAGADLIYEVLDTDHGEGQERLGRKLDTITGVIRFDQVTFAYDDGPPALRDVSLSIQPGEQVALVGETGAGKSTIVNLILGFSTPTSGQVLIDGVDLDEIDLSSVRSQMVVVLQEGYIFSGTVADNIAYGRLGASRSDVEDAARQIGAHERFLDLPAGYDTDVGQLGRLVSPGQRQLIALARAVLAEPRVLVLDEATSNVDPMTEAVVHHGTRELMRDRTSIVIAHRFSEIVTEADRILVVDGGRIVEAGRHLDLIAQDGVYARLYRHQHGADRPADRHVVAADGAGR